MRTDWNGVFTVCPENITMYHNASQYSIPSPLYNSHVYLNSSTGIAFECNFDTIYSAMTAYAWYVNGVEVKDVGKNFEFYFTDGNYTVTCQASYQIPNCDPCKRTASMVPITISGTNVSSFTQVAIIRPPGTVVPEGRMFYC